MKWSIREVHDEERRGTVYEYDISLTLPPDGVPYRERRVVPEFDEAGRRIATRTAREQWVQDRFAFCAPTARRTRTRSRHASKLAR